jgi:hypothetical protein
MNDEDRLARMEARIAELEDRLAIYQLFATYGPGVDSLSGDAVRDLWAEDGTYETEHHVFRGADEVSAIVRDPMHLRYIERGCAHVMSMPRILLDGDTASATGYSRVYVHREGEWVVDRASANRWELARIDGAWKVTRRVNKLLKGTPEARAVMGQDL